MLDFAAIVRRAYELEHGPTPEEIAYMQAHVHEDRRGWFTAINVVCMVLVYVAVGLRVISRRKIGIKIGLDDYLIMAAMVSVVLFSRMLGQGSGERWYCAARSDLGWETWGSNSEH